MDAEATAKEMVDVCNKIARSYRAGISQEEIHRAYAKKLCRLFGLKEIDECQMSWLYVNAAFEAQSGKNLSSKRR